MKEENKKLGTWKTRCLDLEKKAKNKKKELKKEVANGKKAWGKLEADMLGLQKCIMIEHTNGFNMALK